jgi:hypothetical protein
LKRKRSKKILAKTAKSFQLPSAPVLLYNTYFRENFGGGGLGFREKICKTKNLRKNFFSEECHQFHMLLKGFAFLY